MWRYEPRDAAPYWLATLPPGCPKWEDTWTKSGKFETPQQEEAVKALCMGWLHRAEDAGHLQGYR